MLSAVGGTAPRSEAQRKWKWMVWMVWMRDCVEHVD